MEAELNTIQYQNTSRGGFGGCGGRFPPVVGENALKFTYSNVEFPIFPGEDTGPPLPGEGEG